MKIIDLRTTDLRVTSLDEIVENAGKTKVYAIFNGSYVKIGFAKNFKKRIKQIQNSCRIGCNEIESFFFVESDSSLESKAHSFFKSKRKLGEWFEITMLEACEFLTNNIIEEKDMEQKEKSDIEIFLKKNGINPILYSSLLLPLYKEIDFEEIKKQIEEGKKFMEEEDLEFFEESFILGDYLALNLKYSKDAAFNFNLACMIMKMYESNLF
ncbi:GIY-YIG nuclease family protein [Cetobacterium somerae]|uniref:GIY-YIG nuclease family protein n=1 Tax=Cetobacterium somerae TaxID=188913 RepID=UPI003D769623